MKVTLAEVLFAQGRLLEIYPRPKHAPADLEQLAKIYYRELGDLDAQAFQFAVSAYCKTSEKYYPKPGELRLHAYGYKAAAAAAETLATRYDRWERHGFTAADGSGYAPCPVCGATVAPPPARIEVRHDHQVHYDAGVGYLGPRTGPADAEGHMLPAPAGTA